jgi:histidinol-phosphate aminotransferase
MEGLLKLNTNESPFGPSPRVLEAIRVEAADTLRLYPDPDATALRHGVQPEQVFVGNGSDEVLAHTFAALLKHKAPLLFPDITYSFYPVYCRLFGIAYETVPLESASPITAALPGGVILPNPNAPTGIALARAEIAALLNQRHDRHPNYRGEALAAALRVARFWYGTSQSRAFRNTCGSPLAPTRR